MRNKILITLAIISGVIFCMAGMTKEIPTWLIVALFASLLYLGFFAVANEERITRWAAGEWDESWHKKSR